MDEKQNIVFFNAFSKEDVDGLLNIFHKKEYPFVLVNAEGHYMNFINEFVEVAMEGVSTPVPPVREYRGEELYQATVFALPEEMMAFGDAQNDIDMIEYAGIGIAMGNGEECLKQIADYVTSDVDENGVFNALHNYNLLD